ncbi:MAG: cytidine deaminase [Flavobacteriales bacterium]|jgi:cytidine deaminase|nr:cytidine deaminase [Flavobacteriales bacterium]
MLKRKIELEFTEYDDFNELDAAEQHLVNEARRAVGHAYAPYSEFKVGAAVLLENGNVIIGSNQENAAYPSGLCAERVALFAAKSQFPDQKIVAVAIATAAGEVTGEPIAPCGGCRQVFAEYGDQQPSEIVLLLAAGTQRVSRFDDARLLLPGRFSWKDLKKGR